MAPTGQQTQGRTDDGESEGGQARMGTQGRGSRAQAGTEGRPTTPTRGLFSELVGFNPTDVTTVRPMEKDRQEDSRCEPAPTCTCPELAHPGHAECRPQTPAGFQLENHGRSMRGGFWSQGVQRSRSGPGATEGRP